MNDEIGKQILDEMRAHNRFNRKAAVVPLAVLVAFVCVYIPFKEITYRRGRATLQSSASWSEARSLLDRAEYTKALHMTRELVKKTPKWYYGYSLLGSIHQTMGDLSKAEENYARAYELFPTEENEKDLLAVRKALQSQAK